MSGQQRRKKRQLLARDGIRIDKFQTRDLFSGIGYEFHCYLCHKRFPPDELQVEHKVPQSRGGTNHLDNLALSCNDCNSEKANMTEDEYNEYKKWLKGRENTPTLRKAVITDIWKGNLTHAISDYWPDEQDQDADK